MAVQSYEDAGGRFFFWWADDSYQTKPSVIRTVYRVIWEHPAYGHLGHVILDYLHIIFDPLTK